VRLSPRATILVLSAEVRLSIPQSPYLAQVRQGVVRTQKREDTEPSHHVAFPWLPITTCRCRLTDTRDGIEHLLWGNSVKSMANPDVFDTEGSRAAPIPRFKTLLQTCTFQQDLQHVPWGDNPQCLSLLCSATCSPSIHKSALLAAICELQRSQLLLSACPDRLCRDPALSSRVSSLLPERSHRQPAGPSCGNEDRRRVLEATQSGKRGSQRRFLR
jgi:hypothetical protein